jgi:hypothetical protein
MDLISRASAWAVVVGVVASCVGAQAADQRVLDCGLSTPGNQVLTSFNLDHGSNFWKHFPAAKGAPELQNSNPALVVVFKGDYIWFRTGQVFQNVVCVSQNGQPHIYPNVDLTGAHMQP